MLATALQLARDNWTIITAVSVAFASTVSVILNVLRIRNELNKSEDYKRKAKIDEILITLKEEELKAIDNFICRPTKEEIQEYVNNHPILPGQMTTESTVRLMAWLEEKIKYFILVIYYALALLPLLFFSQIRRVVYDHKT